MPDLEPITREEMLLDGQDLEPITRKEMFIKRIYDKTQVVPEPITREEMFLKKAGDETTDVTIEQLNVSENGTYSESGKAYSPVIVDVSLPENAYLVKDIPNTPCDIATFTDGSNLPMPSLKVGIEPIQEGSGTPSPTNIRPISGWDECNVSVCGVNFLDLSNYIIGSASNYDKSVGSTLSSGGSGATVSGATNPLTITNNTNWRGATFISDLLKSGTTYNIAWSTSATTIGNVKQTFYLINSNKTILSKKNYTSGGTNTWSFTPDNDCYCALAIESSTQQDVVLSDLQIEIGSTATTYTPYNGHTTTIPFTDSQGNPIEVFGGECDVVNGTIKPNIEYDSYNGETLVGRWISDRDEYAEGTTPTIGAQVVDLGAYGSDISVQPTSIKSLEGTNNVWADCGQITEGSYFSKGEEE